MAIRQFKLQLDSDDGEEIYALIAIMETTESLHQMREMVYFWSGANRVVERYKGDITKAFLHYLGGAIDSNPCGGR